MSKLLTDNSGIGPKYSTSYVMLNDYCKNNTSLGVSSVAPIYAPYNLNQAVQDVPIFKGTNYDEVETIATLYLVTIGLLIKLVTPYLMLNMLKANLFLDILLYLTYKLVPMIRFS